jgi:hypothetical protein
MLQFVLILGDKSRILAAFFVSVAEFVKRVNQRFGDERAAIRTEMAAIVR